MMVRKATLPATFAALLVLGGAFAAVPAAAQSEDRNAREQFERGYRAGREDERRAGGESGDQEARAAMEFLDYARQQMERGDLRAAWIALGRAEVRFAPRSLPAGADEAAAGAAVGAIRAARQALSERDVDLALARTERAINLAERGMIVGRNVPGRMLNGAGEPGAGQPLTGGGRGR